MLALYKTVAEPLDDAAAGGARRATTSTFTSASSARFFARAPAGTLAGPRIASIGPATSDALREHGPEPDLEADPHTPDGLVEALLADVSDVPRQVEAGACQVRDDSRRGRSPSTTLIDGLRWERTQ